MSTTYVPSPALGALQSSSHIHSGTLWGGCNYFSDFTHVATEAQEVQNLPRITQLAG